MDVLRVLIIIGILWYCRDWILGFFGMILISIMRLLGR